MNTIKISIEMDDLPVRGNAMVSGDPKYDRKVENQILKRLDDGDLWAWAQVEVWAERQVAGTTIRGESEWLGACCYRDEEEFRATQYFKQMSEAALASLETEISGVRQELAA